jgi:hypothetical protein
MRRTPRPPVNPAVVEMMADQFRDKELADGEQLIPPPPEPPRPIPQPFRPDPPPWSQHYHGDEEIAEEPEPEVEPLARPEIPKPPWAERKGEP